MAFPPFTPLSPRELPPTHAQLIYVAAASCAAASQSEDSDQSEAWSIVTDYQDKEKEPEPRQQQELRADNKKEDRILPEELERYQIFQNVVGGLKLAARFLNDNPCAPARDLKAKFHLYEALFGMCIPDRPYGDSCTKGLMACNYFKKWARYHNIENPEDFWAGFFQPPPKFSYDKLNPRELLSAPPKWGTKHPENVPANRVPCFCILQPSHVPAHDWVYLTICMKGVLEYRAPFRCHVLRCMFTEEDWSVRM